MNSINRICKRRMPGRNFQVVLSYLCLAAIILIASPIPSLGQDAPVAEDNNSTKFEKVYTLVKDAFYDAHLHKVNWKKIGEDYRAKLPAIKSKAEFEDLVNKMLDELHASHTAYVNDDDIEFYMLPSVMGQDTRGHQVEHIGVMGKYVGRDFLVAATLDGGPAEKAAILAGDILHSADGQPFTTAGSFRGKAGMPVKVELKREGETGLRSVEVTPVRENMISAYLQAMQKSVKILNVDGKKIGYVHLWTMSNIAFQQALEQLVTRRLHDTDGLILDLRDGYGGNPFGYSDMFFRPDVAWEQRDHTGIPITKYMSYGKPMALLINGGTRSAKEFLSYQFKISHRATLIGLRTAGAFLGAGGFPVGKDGYLELAVLGLKVDGKPLEDKGVSPDLEVQPKYSYSDKDSQLLAAERKLLETLTSIHSTL